MTKFQEKILRNNNNNNKKQCPFVHKILAKYWQNYIFMTTVCNFPHLCYQYIGKNNIIQKNKKRAYLENGTSDCPQTKALLISVVSLSWLIYLQIEPVSIFQKHPFQLPKYSLFYTPMYIYYKWTFCILNNVINVGDWFCIFYVLFFYFILFFYFLLFIYIYFLRAVM